MQTYTAAATVESDRGLHLLDLPFSPGAQVEVNIMERAEDTAPVACPSVQDSQREPIALDSDARRAALIRQQYQTAEQFPGEYVVLCSTEVLFHSRIRSEAFRAYDRVSQNSNSERPVIVEPGRNGPPVGVLRGRTLTGQLPQQR